MKRILNIKTFSIHPTRKKNDDYALDDINGMDSYSLLKKHFVEYINLNGSVQSDPSLEFEDDEEISAPRNLTYIHLTPRDYLEYDPAHSSPADLFIEFDDARRFICGKISRGRFGQKGAVINTQSQQVFQIEESHCVPTPFFFLIAMPAHKDKGFFLTEKIGQAGIVETFSYLIKKFFQEKIDNVTLIYKDFTEPAVIRSFINKGSFKEIILSTNLPRNIEDSYGLERYEESPYVVELRIKPARNSRISGEISRKIQNIFAGKSEKLLNFEEAGFTDPGNNKRNYSIKVVSDYNNKQRTIHMNNPGQIMSGYDVDVPDDKAGHSDFVAIKNAACDLLNSFDLNIFNHDQQEQI